MYRRVVAVGVAACLAWGCAASPVRSGYLEPDPDGDPAEDVPGGSARLPAHEEFRPGHVSAGARAFERAPDPLPNPFAPGAAHVTFDTDQVGVEFHIFSIGQADSMLVIAPNGTTLLYDLGELNWNTRANCLQVRDEIHALTGAYHVDYLVVSHFHQDHVGGPPRVVTDRNGRQRIFQGGGVFCLLEGTPDFFTVGTLIDRGDGEQEFEPERQDSHQFIIDSWERWIQNGTLQQRVPASFVTGLIDLGPGIAVEVLATAGHAFDGDPGALAAAEAASPDQTYRADQPASPNDFSIALEFTVGSDFELFTAGDLTGAPGEPPYDPFMVTEHHQVYTNVESHMVQRWNDVAREADVEVYVANHHGSGNSSTVDLASALEPEVVIYSVGGRYRHPNREIADRFLTLGADQLLTTAADDEEWANGVFPSQYGNGWENPAGDILVFAPLQGSWYTVATNQQAIEYPILTDAQEQ
jgi:glyoxylase-like metal-dependent hydrolase (beta-lactamase superfamily II)